MKRTILRELESWKDSPNRKPLILKGARQVGKTWVVKEFGRQFYDDVAYFSFDEQQELGQFFVTTKNVNRILENLTVVNEHPIHPGKTLIVFDEIQECNPALGALKYFCENAPDYHVACAGSLLGVTIEGSFPVGKVDFLDMWPMTFLEFLEANGDENLSTYIRELNKIENIPDAFLNPLHEKLKIYFLTGGMPEAVLAWTQDRNITRTETVQTAILEAYRRDFSKHAEKKDRLKILHIWDSIPSQLSRENKKFLYGAAKSGARAREYEDAIEWLVSAGLVYKIYRIEKPGLPLSAYDDLSAFKLYLSDVGLLRKLSGLAPSAFAEGDRLFEEFRGAFAENYVLQSLKTMFSLSPRYWSQSHPLREVDFILQYDNHVLPVEVKSGTQTASESLRTYRDRFSKDTPLRVRFSKKNLTLDGDILNIPLPLAGIADRLIGLTELV
ncbi:ATPase [Clostridia bacterium]|nr:ATPase [Clostridia bacterium]